MANYSQPELLEFKLSTNEVIEYKPDVFMLKLELDTLGQDLTTDSDSKTTLEESQELNDSISLNMQMMLEQTLDDTSSSQDEFNEDDVSDSLTLRGQAITLGGDLGSEGEVTHLQLTCKLTCDDDDSASLQPERRRTLLPAAVGTCEEIESIMYRELEVVRNFHRKTSSKFETDVLSLQGQLRTLEENLNNDRALINHLTAEKNEFQQEIMALKQKCDDDESRYKTELERLRKELQNQAALNDQLHVQIKEINDRAVQIEKEVKLKKKSGFCACLS
ncbi:uncharacterized protein LOC122845401 [Gambusia affinis]|uniref:uncharacterized protein LOC122845401 n=1 Tax=Gambusia affinis TaxID=33528 RepID=UPI001CDB9275|nr:uncharacterized protein LOC122845401 [Gambusia affinis]